jgi:HD-GYP domain-containing protein (c-di-GMP phosphodiesterase class II)
VRGRARELWAPILVGVALLVPLAYLLYRAFDGASNLIDRDQRGPIDPGTTFDIWPWLIIATLAGLAAIAGWLWAASRASDGAALAARDREIEQLHRSREEQRRWNRELSARLSELQRSEGSLGGRDDVRDLVLRVAISLLDAEKGLLLSRRDDDHDGNLDVVAYQGFSSNPESSAIVQRFGGETVERDRIVRIGRDDMPREHAAPADAEIDNLVAIPIYISDEFHGVVICANGEALEHDDEVLVALGDHAGAILENSRLHGELRGSYLATVKMLADAIEVKDPFLRGHSDEVSGLVRAMARRLELSGDRREQLIFGSLLHDVGKIGVSERILLKPGPLTDEEFSAIKLHPRIGYRLVSQVPLLQPVAPAILHHHERWDGNGYPSGLAGERIPLEARVVAIIDAFSAMVSDRPYRAAISVDDALAELERSAGTHFDPSLVEMFVQEVRAGIPEEATGGLSLADALDDPELQAFRGSGIGGIGVGMFSSTDSLTLLHSHSYFRERLNAEVSRVGLEQSSDEHLALIMIEATNLEELNREGGYAATDKLLERLARTIESCAVDCGGIAGRDAGARFAILAPGLDPTGTESVVASLRDKTPDELDLQIGSAPWVRGVTAEGLVAAASARVA